MAFYSKVSYWDERYLSTSNKGPFEWYQGYQSLRHLMNPIHFSAQMAASAKQSDGTLPLSQQQHQPQTTTRVNAFPSRDQCRVLILGCGNSSFGEDMQRDGWTGPITNVDFSEVVIDQMKAKYNDTFYKNWKGNNTYKRESPEKMEYMCADIKERLPFVDQSFDLVVCKGSFDAILCSAGSKTCIGRVVKECVRLLAGGHGILFVVTHGNPDSRIEFFEYDNKLDHYWFGVNVHNVARPASLNKNGSHNQQKDYVYVCRKRLQDSPESSAALVAENKSETKSASASENTGNVV